MAKLGNLTWDPLTVSAVTSRDTIRPREHAWRLDALATMPMLAERELTQLEDAPGKTTSRSLNQPSGQ